MNGEFLYNLYLIVGLFVALTTVIGVVAIVGWRAFQRLESDIRRVEKGVRRDIRRVDKRLSREIRKTNRQVRKTNESVWWLWADMQVVKDRLNIGADSRPVASAPVASDPEAGSSASSDSVVTGPAPGSSESGSGVSVPVADDAVSRPVGSRAAAHRQGGAGAVPSGIIAPLPAAEK